MTNYVFGCEQAISSDFIDEFTIGFVLFVLPNGIPLSEMMN